MHQPQPHDQAELGRFLWAGGCIKRQLHQCRRNSWDVGALEGAVGSGGAHPEEDSSLYGLYSSLGPFCLAAVAPGTVETLVVL